MDEEDKGLLSLSSSLSLVSSSVNKKNVLAEIDFGWEILPRFGYIINCI